VNLARKLSERFFIHAEMQHRWQPIARHPVLRAPIAYERCGQPSWRGVHLALVHHSQAIHRVALHVELAVVADQKGCRFLRQSYFSHQDRLQVLRRTRLIAKHRLPPSGTPTASLRAGCRSAGESCLGRDKRKTDSALFYAAYARSVKTVV
jgi:hypothetical protein